MTRRRSSPLGLELVLSVVLALVVLPLLSHGAPVQESQGDLQRYSEGCYYNYNHYSEGDRILTNEPCLNCTCHNKMLMCYLRVCPFTKPIGHDCTVEKREDQCCPIVTCPEVPVDIAHHSNQLTTSAPGTELSIPEKYGCHIDNKFYVEGAQVPSNPNKPCELCYCIRNRTACLMQECTLHIDGCQPIYNKGSCCPVRYNCDHENELLEIEDFSTTTTTVRPTQGYLLPSTTSPTVTTDCIHNNSVYADGASITGKNSCEHCYCMRGDIVCAVQECEMPTLESGAKTCRALPPAEGECCPSNYVCDDDSVTTEGGLIEDMFTTIAPGVQSNLHESVSQEDVQLQEHIDDKIPVTEVPAESDEQQEIKKDEIIPTTILPIAGDVAQPAEQEVKDSESEEEKPILTTVLPIKETVSETTQSPIEHSTTHKTEEGFVTSHEDKEDESKEDEIIDEDKEVTQPIATTVSPFAGDIQKTEKEEEAEEELVPTKIPESSPVEEPTTQVSEEESEEKDESSTLPSIDIRRPDEEAESGLAATSAPVEESDHISTLSAETASENVTPETIVPSKDHIKPQEILPGNTEEDNLTELPTEATKPEFDSEVVSSTIASVEDSEDSHKVPVTEVSQHADSVSDSVTSLPPKTPIEPQETSSESSEFSEESTHEQEESQDKIDEDITEHPSIISTNSPAYETITEGDSSNIGVPEAGDHKTESDLPQKKPKDEPEAVENVTIPSDDTSESEIKKDSTTEHTKLSEDEHATTKLPIFKDEEAVDHSTQSAIEEKPVKEDDEIPAVVEEITESTSKPVSGDIPSQTTVLPVKDDEAIESHEKDEEQSTETSYDEKHTTPRQPIKTDEEEESSGLPAEDLADITTSVPSIDDSAASVTEKEEEHKEVSTDKTPFTPDVIGSEKPSDEQVPIKEIPDATTRKPVETEDEEEPSEQSTEKSDGEKHTTPEQPHKISIGDEDESSEVPVEGLADSTTSVPSIEDSGSFVTEKEEDKEIVLDHTPSIPSDADSQKPIEEQAPMKDEQDTTVKTPSVIAGEVSSSEEEEDKPQTDIISGESSTLIPESEHESSTIVSLDHEVSSEEEEEIKSKPHSEAGESTTTIPLSVESDEKEHFVKDKLEPEPTPAPTSSEPESPSVEEDEEKKPIEEDLTDFTTKHTSETEDEETSSEEDISTSKPHLDSTKSPAPVDHGAANVEGESSHQEPELDVHSTVIPPKQQPSEDSSQEAIADSSTTSPNAIDSEIPSSEEDIHKTPEHEIASTTTRTSLPTEDKIEKETSVEESGTTLRNKVDEHVDSDSTITPPTISEDTESSEEHKPTSDEDIKHQPSTDAPSIDVSEEGIEKETEGTSDLTTVPSITSDSQKPVDEEIKTKPEETLDLTTASPTVADSSVPEVDNKEKDNEISEEEISTDTSSPADYETAHDLESSKPTTAAPQPIGSDEPTIAPLSHEDNESSVSSDKIEDSNIPLHDIIPSAIPGEGDCLSNGKTFANNTTVPTSTECEISCACISSIIVCEKVKCSEPPKPNNCVLDQASTDRCCPQYICGIDSFPEDQRPTTSGEIEDEEIQFTTLAPSNKYPSIPTETETHKLEPHSTEIPISSDEESTYSSVDIEQKPVAPEDSMSHIKDDETQESSTKQDISEEDSTTTGQPPITIKPTKQVTGDIEEPVEVTSAPEYVVPSKKPEEISGEEELSPTTDKKPIVPLEEHSTESAIEKEYTTLKPTKTDVSTEAQYVPTVTEKDESTQSEETSETSEESSNESGEEIDSEEDTQSPLDHKEEDQTITTSKPIVSEHAGDIEPIDESTSIPEMDYSKPEMPEDLSHTKVEDEKEKPTGDLETVPEKEEPTKKVTTTAPTTILSPVEPTEDGIHKVEIADKKDDIPSSESEEAVSHEETSIHPTTSPVKSDEEYDSETTTKKEKPESETSAPVPSLEGGLDSSQTISPIDKEDRPIAGTIAPEKDDESSEHLKPSSTSAPVYEDHSIAGSGDTSEEIPADIDSHIPITEIPHRTSDEESVEGSGAPITEDKESEIADQTSVSPINKQEDHAIEGSGAPILGDKSEQDEIESHTSGSGIDTQTPASDLEDEIKTDKPFIPDIEEQSVEGSGAPISEDKTHIEQEESTTPAIEKQSPVSDLEEENISVVTSAPTVEEGSGIISEDKTSAPASDIEEGYKIDVTTSPAVEKHSTEGSGAPVQDEYASGTTASVIEDDHVTSPADEEGSGAHVFEEKDKTPMKQDEIVSQTAVPAIDKQPTVAVDDTENELDEEKKTDSQTIVPPSEDELVKPTSAPVSADEVHTLAPSEGDESEEEISNQTKAPSVTLPSSEEQSEEQQSSEESQTEGTDDKIISPTTSSSEEEQEDIVAGTVAPVAGDKYEETDLPEDKKPVAPAAEKEQESDSTTVPSDIKDISEIPAEAIPTKDGETSDENIHVTTSPSIISSDDSATSVPIETKDETGLPSKEVSEGSTISTPVEAIDEHKDSTDIPLVSEGSTISTPVETIDEHKESAEEEEESSTSIPINTVDDDKTMDSTELPSASTTAKPIKSTDEDIETTQSPQVDSDKKHTPEETSATEKEPESPVTVSTSKLDDEEPSHTEASEEEDKIDLSDKTLITTESSVPSSETVGPSAGVDSEEKTERIPTDKPELSSDETSPKDKEDSDSSLVTAMPDMPAHEIHQESVKPESDDQILVDDVVTAKPADVGPAQTEISTEEKKPVLEDSHTSTPAPVVDASSESNEEPEKQDSAEEVSAEDIVTKSPQPELPAIVPSGEDVSPVETKPEEIERFTTAKPLEPEASTESEEDDILSKTTTSKPVEGDVPTKFEEHDDSAKVSSTVAPVDQEIITSSPIEAHSTEKSGEEKEHTEGPKEDSVTEHADAITTVLPSEDTESITKQPISHDLPETSVQVTEKQEDEKEVPEVSIVTESASSEESEDKTQAPAIQVESEETKPPVKPTDVSEDVTDKAPVPEIKPEISQSPESIDESEEKTQAPEVQSEVTEDDHKQHVQPTEGAIVSTTSDKPIEQVADDKIDSDLPKPIVSDEQPSSEDETPLSTTLHPLFPQIEQDRTTSAPQLNATDKDTSQYVPSSEQTTSQAITNAPPTHYQPPGYGQVPPQYPSYTEDEYTDEDETEVFGPGTCRYGGKLFVSAQQIPRDDPCDFCFCFRSDIICLQQSCPPPISGCHEEPISGFCCPRYECPVSMATTLNITTSTTTTSTTLPPHFLHHAYRGAAAKNGCHINGKSYKVGDKIDSASGPCMHCTCGGDGQMKCDPKTCSPEPMLRQMIAVVASRRR